MAVIEHPIDHPVDPQRRAVEGKQHHSLDRSKRDVRLPYGSGPGASRSKGDSDAKSREDMYKTGLLRRTDEAGEGYHFSGSLT